MDRLTQEQAERCARAIDAQMGENPYTHDEAYIIDGVWYSLDCLPLDPLFWLPRLWERLKGLTGETISVARVKYPGGPEFVATASRQPQMTADVYQGKDEIEALCSAIEALKEARK